MRRPIERLPLCLDDERRTPIAHEASSPNTSWAVRKPAATSSAAGRRGDCEAHISSGHSRDCTCGEQRRPVQAPGEAHSVLGQILARGLWPHRPFCAGVAGQGCKPAGRGPLASVCGRGRGSPRVCPAAERQGCENSLPRQLLRARLPGRACSSRCGPARRARIVLERPELQSNSARDLRGTGLRFTCRGGMATLPTLSFPWNGEIRPEHAFGAGSETGTAASWRLAITGVDGTGRCPAKPVACSCSTSPAIAAHVLRLCRDLAPPFPRRADCDASYILPARCRRQAGFGGRGRRPDS